MITRQWLLSGAYLDSFADLPHQPRWSAQRIRDSMQQALAQRDPAQPVWLFAYGSLIWNPCFHYAEQQRAELPGWHRSFCLRLLGGRASMQTPGRMLALQAGGQTSGVAMRLAEEGLHDELWLVWVREMLFGMYRPVWATAHLADGRQVQALTFTAEPTHPMYEADASVDTAARLIASARGHLGSNSEYLLQLDHTLAQHALQDDYITALAQAVRARMAQP